MEATDRKVIIFMPEEMENKEQEKKKRLQEVEVLIDPDEDLEEVPIARVVREPMVHQVGKQALGFVLALVAERIADVTYDQLLKVWRNRKSF